MKNRWDCGIKMFSQINKIDVNAFCKRIVNAEACVYIKNQYFRKFVNAVNAKYYNFLKSIRKK